MKSSRSLRWLAAPALALACGTAFAQDVVLRIHHFLPLAATIHAKFFTPWTGLTWFVTEGQQEEDDFLFFGFVIGLENEWGYFVLSELESVRGSGGLRIERDLHFTQKRQSQIAEIDR